MIGTNRFSYTFDSIGNRCFACADASTNSYSANSLNQYTSVLRASAPPRDCDYDLDGNLEWDGGFEYCWDSENRLVAVEDIAPTNGAVRVLNRYDHRHRRTQKTVQRLHVDNPPPPSPPSMHYEWNTVETHTYVWDENNIALEWVAFSNGTTRVCEYFWGPDLSGAEQGAGGVGGLLAVSIDGTYYIPCYDHNGNIVRYISENGALSAAYEYDPFGNVLSATGPLADEFTFGFSTKPLDRETGLVSYQRRFYSPSLGRFLNRDPMEEEGGKNLYAFCGNDVASRFDKDGCAHFEVRSLRGLPGILNYSCFASIIGLGSALMLDWGLADDLNIEILHEHLFYDDGSNVGYGKDGQFPKKRKQGTYDGIPMNMMIAS